MSMRSLSTKYASMGTSNGARLTIIDAWLIGRYFSAIKYHGIPNAAIVARAINSFNPAIETLNTLTLDIDTSQNDMNNRAADLGSIKSNPLICVFLVIGNLHRKVVIQNHKFAIIIKSNPYNSLFMNLGSFLVDTSIYKLAMIYKLTDDRDSWSLFLINGSLTDRGFSHGSISKLFIITISSISHDTIR